MAADSMEVSVVFFLLDVLEADEQPAMARAVHTPATISAAALADPDWCRNARFRRITE